jgi:ABC-2 type transport system permease protein
MAALFRTEMVKQWRRTRTWVTLGLTVAIPIIIAIALKANPPSTPEGRGDFTFGALHTGLFLPVASLQFMSRFLLVIIIALFAGDSVASEASWGNLRAMLTRPVGRGRFLLAKVESTALLALIATALIGVTGLIAGVIAFGWHPLSISIGPAELRSLHESTGQILGNLAIASGYVLWGISGIAALAFMASTMTDSPAGAVFAGFGLYIVSQILDNITALGSIRYGFPTHYLDAWTRLFTHPSGGPTGDMLRGTLLQIPYVVIFGGIAWWYFRRKDILS